MKKEFVDIIDENDNVIGKTTKIDMIKKKLMHRATLMFVFNSKGELFIHQRSKNKEIFPGLWAIGAGGNVSSGEDYYTTAKRELKEELGVDSEVEFMFDFDFKSKEGQYKAKVYKALFNGKIRLQKEEIEQGKFATIDEIKDMSKRGLLCPDTALFFKKYLEMKK